MTDPSLASSPAVEFCSDSDQAGALGGASVSTTPAPQRKLNLNAAAPLTTPDQSGRNALAQMTHAYDCPAPAEEGVGANGPVIVEASALIFLFTRLN